MLLSFDVMGGKAFANEIEAETTDIVNEEVIISNEATSEETVPSVSTELLEGTMNSESTESVESAGNEESTVSSDSSINVEASEPPESSVDVEQTEALDDAVNEETTELSEGSVNKESAELPEDQVNESTPTEAANVEVVNTVTAVQETAQVSSFKETDRFFTVPTQQIPVYNNDNGKNILVGYVLPNREYKISRFSEGTKWIVVSFGDKNAYVRSDYVKPSSGSMFANPVMTSERQSGFITNSKAAVYQEASNTSTIHAYLQKDVDYSVLGEYYNFYLIDVGGRVSYLHKDNLKTISTAGSKIVVEKPKYFVAPKNIAVYYQGATSDYQVGTLLPNQEYQISHFSSDPNWFIIAFGHRNAYIRLSDVTPSSGASFTNPVKTTTGTTTVTIKSKAAAYKLPDNQAVNIYAYLQPSVTYQVLGSYYNYYLVNISGRYGYVHRDNTVMNIIVIDPGHGGKDPGAIGNGLLEKEVAFDIATRTKWYLENKYIGHQTILTRYDNNTYPTLSERTEQANKLGANVFVSIHLNSGGGTGYEDFIHTSCAPSSSTQRLQTIMHNQIAPIYTNQGIRDRGAKKADLHVLRETHMDAILTENGFIDSYNDMSKVKQVWFRDQVAWAHAKGIAEFLGLASK